VVRPPTDNTFQTALGGIACIGQITTFQPKMLDMLSLSANPETATQRHPQPEIQLQEPIKLVICGGGKIAKSIMEKCLYETPGKKRKKDPVQIIGVYDRKSAAEGVRFAKSHSIPTFIYQPHLFQAARGEEQVVVAITAEKLFHTASQQAQNYIGPGLLEIFPVYHPGSLERLKGLITAAIRKSHDNSVLKIPSFQHSLNLAAP